MSLFHFAVSRYQLPLDLDLLSKVFDDQDSIDLLSRDDIMRACDTISATLGAIISSSHAVRVAPMELRICVVQRCFQVSQRSCKVKNLTCCRQYRFWRSQQWNTAAASPQTTELSK